MHKIEEVNRLLAELSAGYQQDTQVLNQDNHCHFQINNETAIDICWNEPMQMLVILIAIEKIDTRDTQLLNELLKSNYFWQASFGTTLSLSQDDKSLWMIDRVPLEYFPQADEFIAYIKHLINGANHCKERIAQQPNSTELDRKTTIQDAPLPPVMNLNHIKI